MAQNVTINLFDVSRTEKTQSLSTTLDEFAALPLEKRLRTDVRLERIECIPPDNIGPVEVVHLDFAKQREIGPGKMGSDMQVSDVGLGAGELFGEETAALYVPKHNWLLILNNHYGIGPSRMATYFNALDPASNRDLFYTLAPKIDQSALDKMKAMKSFADIEVTANVGAFETGDVLGESLFQATNSVKAQRVSLKFCANEAHKKGHILDRASLFGFVNQLLTKGNDLSKLRVKSADETATEQDRVIDLIEHKIRQRYSVKELVVFNHRYTYESKIKLLRKACRAWLKKLT